MPHRTTTRPAWRAIVLRHESEKFSVIAERDVPTGDEGFAAWLAPLKPSKLLVVLPPSATVCRLCTLPPTQGEQLTSALRLQAETALLGSVSTHRVGMCALPGAIGGTGGPSGPGSMGGGRQGVIVSWPVSATVAEIPDAPAHCDVRYVPVVASLLGLLGGESPTTPLIRADREDGTIIFIIGTASGLLLRSTLEDASDLAQWREGIQRAAAETLLAADRGADEIRSLQAEIAPQLDRATDGSFIVLPASVATAFSRYLPGGRTGDISKDADRTIALGAALAATGPLAGLTSMRGTLPVPPPHPLERVSRWLAVPRNMLAVLFVAMLVFLFGPLGFSGLRYGILSWKLPDVEKVAALNRETQQSVLVYRQLQQEAWPMTKLLGDLSNSLPEGIEIEMVQLAHGDGVTLKGVAKPFTEKAADGKASQELSAQDQLTRMETMLRATRIFTNAQYKWGDRDSRGYVDFSLNCDVSQPTRVVAWDKKQDFAQTTLRERKYPNLHEIEKGNQAGASDAGRTVATAPDENSSATEATEPRSVPSASSRAAVEPPATATPDAESTEKPETIASADGAASMPSRGIGRTKHEGDNPADGSPGKGGDPSKPAQPSAGPAVEVPGPFSDEEIKALTKGEAQTLLGEISRARQLPTLDEDTKKRLREDFQRVLARAKVAT